MTPQSRAKSHEEAFVNSAIGLVLSLLLTPVVLYLTARWGVIVQGVSNTIVFTALSYARIYGVRRWYESSKGKPRIVSTGVGHALKQ